MKMLEGVIEIKEGVNLDISNDGVKFLELLHKKYTATMN